jgi:hypothetical protein
MIFSIEKLIIQLIKPKKHSNWKMKTGDEKQ